MKKLIFIDIDGTLCDRNGVVPESAIIAIQKARQNGHQVFLCTGRSKGEIYEKIFDIGFDGLIGGAGAYVECDNKVLFHKCLDDNIVKNLVNYFDEHKIAFVLEANKGVYMQVEHIEILKSIFKASNVENNDQSDEFMGILKPIGTALEAKSVNKILFFNSSKSIAELQQELKENLLILPNSIGGFGDVSGEISDININKATGIQIVLEHFGKTKEAVIAIGDGPNDIEMLEFAGVGIAMGNSTEHLKSHADEVTDVLSENGLYNSFKKHELI